MGTQSPTHDNEKARSARAPVLFIGHGSPMNALENNAFTQSLKKFGETAVKPAAVVCVSAHWMTKGTYVTHMRNPVTIHDFFGFPQELFAVQYPAPGSPEIAESIIQKVNDPKIIADEDQWGLDHGTWSVMRHIFPNADVPTLQISLDLSRPPRYHYELGAKLKWLRDQNILIVGSGNIVHNLSLIKWDAAAPAYDWAREFDAWAKTCLSEGDFDSLIDAFDSTPAGKLSVPTIEHYLPLLYVLGASDTSDRLEFLHEEIQNSSISMRTALFIS